MQKGVKCWVKHPDEADDAVFVAGTVVGVEAGKVTVETAAETKAWKEEVVLKATTNSSAAKDHTQLDVLNEATLLENTKLRFMADTIYTCAAYEFCCQLSTQHSRPQRQIRPNGLMA